MVQVPKELVCILQRRVNVILVQVTHKVLSPFECGVNLLLGQVSHEAIDLVKHLFTIYAL